MMNEDRRVLGSLSTLLCTENSLRNFATLQEIGLVAQEILFRAKTQGRKATQSGLICQRQRLSHERFYYRNTKSDFAYRRKIMRN
ncbi:MAG: hypothetical protein HY231_26795 [Acidobacteria bacterium]|nr:hypothetical protein [Acidobacteriota bacterium]